MSLLLAHKEMYLLPPSCWFLQFLISRWPLIFSSPGVVVQPDPLETYKRITGALTVTSMYMPYQTEVWGAITDPGAFYSWPTNDFVFLQQWGSVPVTIDMGIQYPRAQVYTASTHVCAYM
jgi:hypothetical protein